MKKSFFNKFLAFSLTLVLVLTASVLPASAAEKVIYAKSLDGKYEYTSIQTAWDAVRNGVTIVMQRDWNLSDRLVLKEDQTGTIYMNGYKIDRGLTKSKSDGEVIYMNAGSRLTLKGCDADGNNITGTEFKIEGQDLNGKTSGTITSGGLITGGYSTNGAGGIHMKDNASLTLDNVIVGGNKVSNNYGGGVNMNNTGDSLTLRNGAKIAYNVATYGGGVYVAASGCNISLYGGSTIEYNYAREYGGGIYSNATSTAVKLNGSSSISNNIANVDGGGYYGNYSYNTIKSTDKTGTMSNNVANHAGGAIFLDSVSWLANENTISGICFDGNRCLSSNGANGGAMYLAQEWTTVQDCIIKNNSAHWGGGVYNINGNNTFDDCTITNNCAEGYGGGFYQGLYNNIQLKDKVIIKNNTRGDDSPDDMYLAEAWLSAAYIVSNPAAGSEIGIRIYDDKSEGKIGEGTEFDETMFFSDAEGFHIRYDSAEEELYLTPNDSENKSYSVTVNDKLQGYYNTGAKLTIDGTPSDSKLAFKQWKGDVAALDSKTKVVASVLKVEKDLRFTSDYVSRASKFTLEVNKPVAGDLLPTMGTLKWTRDGIDESPEVEVYWLVQNGTTTQTASGTADYNTNYSVAAVIDANPSYNLAFTDTVTGTVIYTGTDGKNQTNKVYVDSTQSTLYMYGNQILTEKAVITGVENVTVNIKKNSTEADLRALLPRTAVVYGEDGKAYIVNTNLDNIDLSTVITDDKVKDEGGNVTIPLKLEDTEKVKNGTGEAEKKLTVKVNVVETIRGTLAVPTASTSSGTYKEDGNVKLDITLASTDDGATIYYKINDAEEFTAYNSGSSISISAPKGEKKSFTVTIKAVEDGYNDSTVAAYTYVLDNPYTVTITKKSTASQDGTDVIGDVYTAQYYKDDKVIIGAPIVSGYVFDKWQDASGITIATDKVQEDTLTVDSIGNNISLTAMYNPIVKPVEIEPDTPAEPDTSHGSTGTYKKPDSTADPTIDQTETVKAKVAALELKARSSKTSKKNIKVVLKMDTEAQATLDEIQSLGYTVKYKFYRSTKKASSYEAKLEKDTKTYINTAGKKGTHYYYKARVKVYDSEGKLVTYTSLKQCKYAARIFG